MTPRETLGVILRSVGLLVSVIAACLVFWASLNVALGGPGFPVGFVLGVPGLLLGVWFLRGARLIVDFAFPERP